MLSRVLALLCVAACACAACFRNDDCGYKQFSSKAPYETIRGDIRDYEAPKNCEAVSLWTLNRHGTRYPKAKELKFNVVTLKDEIVAQHEAGRGQLCAQVVENLRNWSWNFTLDELTETGYNDLYNIGKRIRQKYPQLQRGTEEDYYFEAMSEPRITNSGLAFLRSFFDGSNFTLSVDDNGPSRDVVRSYEICDRHERLVWKPPILDEQMKNYFETPEFVSVQRALENRLGFSTPLTPAIVYALFEMCRHDRSAAVTHQSPWCGIFSNEDLDVLGYRDDVQHYYRAGYGGSWVNIELGKVIIKDLYKKFDAVVKGDRRKVTGYFTHAGALELAACALGIHKDPELLQATSRNTSRLWRTTHIAPFSVNLVSVLYRCQDTGSPSYRVQLFWNEQLIDVCPEDGCTWQQFQDKFQSFTSANMDFCSMDYFDNSSNSSSFEPGLGLGAKVVS